jgi:hypothetical protein
MSSVIATERLGAGRLLQSGITSQKSTVLQRHMVYTSCARSRLQRTVGLSTRILSGYSFRSRRYLPTLGTIFRGKCSAGQLVARISTILFLHRRFRSKTGANAPGMALLVAQAFRRAELVR